MTTGRNRVARRRAAGGTPRSRPSRHDHVEQHDVDAVRRRRGRSASAPDARGHDRVAARLEDRLQQPHVFGPSSTIRISGDRVTPAAPCRRSLRDLARAALSRRAASPGTRRTRLEQEPLAVALHRERGQAPPPGWPRSPASARSAAQRLRCRPSPGSWMSISVRSRLLLARQLDALARRRSASMDAGSPAWPRMSRASFRLRGLSSTMRIERQPAHSSSSAGAPRWRVRRAISSTQLGAAELALLGQVADLPGEAAPGRAVRSPSAVSTTIGHVRGRRVGAQPARPPRSRRRRASAGRAARPPGARGAPPAMPVLVARGASSRA